MYDVIVVGAGPSGASTAYFLSLKGYKVAIFERDPKIGARVICGEYLPDATSLDLPSWLRRMYEEAFRDHVVHSLSKVSVVVNGRKFATDYLGHSIDRGGMIRDLVDRASSMGAEVRTSDPVMGVKVSNEVRVVTRSGTYKSRYVVGADGYKSVVVRSLAPPNKELKDDLAVAFPVELEIDVESPEEMTLYISKEYSPGTYAWIIPRGPKRANVGIGVRASYWEGDPRPILYKFLSFLGFHEKVRVVGRYVPVSGKVVPTLNGRTFLVGDSANMVVPVNGGGMHNGIIASILLAESLESEDPASKYGLLIKRYVEPQVRLGLRYRQAADFLMKTNLLNGLTKFVPSSLMGDVMTARKTPYYPLILVFSLLYRFVRA